MNWPTKKLEELVLGGKLAHGGNPVLRWMASNVSIEKDAADNWKPSKKLSSGTSNTATQGHIGRSHKPPAFFFAISSIAFLLWDLR